MEEWRIINDYPNYSISSLGSVRNNATEKILKTFINKRGYYRIALYKDNKRQQYSIHRLIGIHFLPNWNNYPEIDHVDRDKTNNKVFNLRWIDRSGNCKNRGKRKDCSSIYKDVCFDKTCNKWKAHKNKKHLGYFKTEQEAYLAIKDNRL
jgi:hypothetical protein